VSIDIRTDFEVRLKTDASPKSHWTGFWRRTQLKERHPGKAAPLEHFSCRNSIVATMTKDSRPFKVIVVGGGIRGIACAVECKRRGYDVFMYEAAKVRGT
jgi:hypothetical protein